jgi:two-component system, OmpR family, response regulator
VVAVGRYFAMTVLVVDDEPFVAKFLCRSLKRRGYTVETCGTGEEAVRLAHELAYDCIVLDWKLPDHDGPAVIRKLRDEGIYTPILMITGDPNGEVVDALTAGADDYCGKPIDAEFYARLDALIRRTRTPYATVEVGNLVVNDRDRSVRVGDEPLLLTRLEFDLLRHLARRAREPVTREELLKAVWGHRNEPVSNNVDVLVGRVRQRLAGTEWKVIAHRGLGYSLTDEP